MTFHPGWLAELISELHVTVRRHENMKVSTSHVSLPFSHPVSMQQVYFPPSSALSGRKCRAVKNVFCPVHLAQGTVILGTDDRYFLQLFSPFYVRVLLSNGTQSTASVCVQLCAIFLTLHSQCWPWLRSTQTFKTTLSRLGATETPSNKDRKRMNSCLPALLECGAVRTDARTYCAYSSLYFHHLIPPSFTVFPCKIQRVQRLTKVPTSLNGNIFKCLTFATAVLWLTPNKNTYRFSQGTQCGTTHGIDNHNTQKHQLHRHREFPEVPLWLTDTHQVILQLITAALCLISLRSKNTGQPDMIEPNQ